MSHKVLRLGMIGGGEGAYIGNIHRLASRLDGRWALVAGAFDLDPERGRAFAISQGLDPGRSYGTWQDLIARERLRSDPVDAVAICTPNFTHYPIARALLEAGFDVICEKPLTATLDDAVDLERRARASGRFLGVCYTYSGYPMVHETRVRIANGDIGEIRTVQVEYPLEWMASPIEREGNAQAAWRTDPLKNGRGGAIGDIGPHAYPLAGFVTGLELESLTADLATFVQGRALDDNAHVLLRYRGGARGLLWSSQVAIGNSNGVRLRVFGEKGSFQWFQEQPNELVHTPINGHVQTIKRGADDLSPDAKVRIRTPAGHPEGYLEAFANLYAGFAEAIGARHDGREPGPLGQNLPVAYDGLKGVAFVDAVVNSHEASDQPWVKPLAV